MSNCTCGRTTRPPTCDGSHCLTPEQYKERTGRLARLFQKPALKDTTREWNNRNIWNDPLLINADKLSGK